MLSLHIFYNRQSEAVGGTWGTLWSVKMKASDWSFVNGPWLSAELGLGLVIILPGSSALTQTDWGSASGKEFDVTSLVTGAALISPRLWLVYTGLEAGHWGLCSSDPHLWPWSLWSQRQLVTQTPSLAVWAPWPIREEHNWAFKGRGCHLIRGCD